MENKIFSIDVDPTTAPIVVNVTEKQFKKFDLPHEAKFKKSLRKYPLKRIKCTKAKSIKFSKSFQKPTFEIYNNFCESIESGGSQGRKSPKLNKLKRMRKLRPVKECKTQSEITDEYRTLTTRMDTLRNKLSESARYKKKSKVDLMKILPPSFAQSIKNVMQSMGDQSVRSSHLGNDQGSTGNFKENTTDVKENTEKITSSNHRTEDSEEGGTSIVKENTKINDVHRENRKFDSNIKQQPKNLGQVNANRRTKRKVKIKSSKNRRTLKMIVEQECLETREVKELLQVQFLLPFKKNDESMGENRNGMELDTKALDSVRHTDQILEECVSKIEVKYQGGSMSLLQGCLTSTIAFSGEISNNNGILKNTQNNARGKGNKIEEQIVSNNIPQSFLHEENLFEENSTKEIIKEKNNLKDIKNIQTSSFDKINNNFVRKNKINIFLRVHDDIKSCSTSSKSTDITNIYQNTKEGHKEDNEVAQNSSNLISSRMKKIGECHLETDKTGDFIDTQYDENRAQNTVLEHQWKDSTETRCSSIENFQPVFGNDITETIKAEPMIESEENLQLVFGNDIKETIIAEPRSKSKENLQHVLGNDIKESFIAEPRRKSNENLQKVFRNDIKETVIAEPRGKSKENLQNDFGNDIKDTVIAEPRGEPKENLQNDFEHGIEETILTEQRSKSKESLKLDRHDKVNRSGCVETLPASVREKSNHTMTDSKTPESNNNNSQEESKNHNRDIQLQKQRAMKINQVHEEFVKLHYIVNKIEDDFDSFVKKDYSINKTTIADFCNEPKSNSKTKIVADPNFHFKGEVTTEIPAEFCEPPLKDLMQKNIFTEKKDRRIECTPEDIPKVIYNGDQLNQMIRKDIFIENNNVDLEVNIPLLQKKPTFREINKKLKETKVENKLNDNDEFKREDQAIENTDNFRNKSRKICRYLRCYVKHVVTDVATEPNLFIRNERL